MKEKWVVLDVITGRIQAELIKGLIEAQGIPARLFGESAATAIGISFGPLGEIELMVPEDQKEEAMEILVSYQDGEFENSLD